MCPYWYKKLVVPLPGPIDKGTILCVDLLHSGDEKDTKKLIGSARLKLIKHLSSRPHGKLDVKVTIKAPQYHHPPLGVYYAPPYGVPQPPPPDAVSRDYYTQKKRTAPPSAISRDYYTQKKPLLPQPSGYTYYPTVPPVAVSRDYYTQKKPFPPQPSGYTYYPTAPPSSGYPYNRYNVGH
ncbi:hypothetical protein Ddye_013869, partial [Dipteronia dyeriana]